VLSGIDMMIAGINGDEVHGSSTVSKASVTTDCFGLFQYNWLSFQLVAK